MTKTGFVTPRGFLEVPQHVPANVPPSGLESVLNVFWGHQLRILGVLRAFCRYLQLFWGYFQRALKVPQRIMRVPVACLEYTRNNFRGTYNVFGSTRSLSGGYLQCVSVGLHCVFRGVPPAYFRKYSQHIFEGLHSACWDHPHKVLGLVPSEKHIRFEEWLRMVFGIAMFFSRRFGSRGRIVGMRRRHQSFGEGFRSRS